MKHKVWIVVNAKGRPVVNSNIGAGISLLVFRRRWQAESMKWLKGEKVKQAKLILAN